MKRFWSISLYVMGGLFVLLTLVLWWVLQTSSGARFALGWVPELKVDRVSGTLAGPLTLEGLKFDSAAARLQAERVHADVRLWPLLSGMVHLDVVQTRAVRLDLKPQPPAAPAADAPLQLPQIRIDALDLVDTQLLGVAEQPIMVQELSGGVQTGAQGVRLQALRVRLPQGVLHADGQIDPQSLVGALEAGFEPTAGPAPLTQLRLKLDSDGQQALVLLNVDGDPTAATVQLHDIRGEPSFSVQVLSPGLDLSRLGLPAGSLLPPVELNIQGDLHGARFEGSVNHAGQSWRLDGTEVQWSPERISFLPLQVQTVTGGRIHAEGALGLKDQQASLQLNVADLQLSPLLPDTEGLPDVVQLQLQIDGSVLDWRTTGTGHLHRDGTDLRLNLDASGDQQQLQVHALRMLTSSGEKALGELELDGSLALAKPHAVDARVHAQGFDLEVLAPQWPGELDLQLAVSGAIEERMQVEIASIRGRVRGADLSGSGALNVRIDGSLPTGRVELDWGGNALELLAADGAPWSARFRIDQPQLIDPALQGSVHGSAATTPDFNSIQAELQGSGIAYAEHRLGRLQLRANTGMGADAPVDIELELADLASGEHSVQTLLFSSSGTLDAHQLQLRGQATQGKLALSAAGGWNGTQWDGLLQTLEVAAGAGVPESLRDRPLHLQAPVKLSLGADSSALELACLKLDDAQVCLGGSHVAAGSSELEFSLHKLPLELGRPWLEAAGLVLEGQLDGEGRLSFEAGAVPVGAITIRGEQLGLLLLSTELPKRFELTRVDLRIAPEESGDRTLIANVGVDIAKLGQLALRTDLSGENARLDVEFDTLEALDDLSPELVKPRGKLSGQLRRDAGVLSGAVTLTEFTADLSAPNISLSDGNIALSGAPDRIVIEGRLSSGEGQLKLSGEFMPDQGLAGLLVDIEGERFLAANLPQARVLISPKLQVRGEASQLRIRGDVGIPQALIDLARFEPAVAGSADVVYVDDPPQEAAAGLPVWADVNIVFGDDVQLRGFGLDGRIAGRLAVRERPGRPTTGRGEISVTGTYKAYGQDLTIERGRLLFANSSLDNPGLDIRAARTIGEIKAGVQVRGSADLPELTTYSSPAMDQLNTISYLVLGRPASQASGGASGQALQNAAQQLGGNLLAKSIGQKLGLEVGIESSAALGGASAFSVGKYLSPRLFVGYGRSLYEELQLFIVRYKVRQHYEIEATSGREQKIGVNFRREL